MSTTKIELDVIQVASPCSVPWDEMKGDDRVRFCRHCQLNVFNLSALPRDEAEALVAKREGRMCVRFYRRADGTVLTRDCPLGVQAIRRQLRKMLAASAAMLVAIVGGSLFARASKPQAIPGNGPPPQPATSKGPLSVVNQWFAKKTIPGKCRVGWTSGDYDVSGMNFPSSLQANSVPSPSGNLSDGNTDGLSAP